jgi:hypothetical protein
MPRIHPDRVMSQADCSVMLPTVDIGHAQQEGVTA